MADNSIMLTKMFEESFRADLISYLEAAHAIGKPFPVAPDIEDMWAKIGESYLPDGMREFQQYPIAALGWIMYVGMAIAKFWHDDWERYGKIDDMYGYLKQQTDFDHLDDYIRYDVLGMSKADGESIEKLVGECGARTDTRLRHLQVESGTQAAFVAFVAALHQLYLMGMAVQLKRMGYEMVKMG